MTNTRFLYDDDIGKIELVQHMGKDITVVNSARVSFGVEKKELDQKDIKLINYLIKHKHTSTLEHNIATFRIKVPLFVRSQHHRHRTWSYNEISRRYTDSDMCFYEPASFRTQHKSNRQSSNINEEINPNIEFKVNYSTQEKIIKASEAVKDFHKYSLEFFDKLLEQGVCREQARGILPQNLYTEYYATANLNNILKFIDLRTHEGAQWEIQKLAEGMLFLITEVWPETIKCYNAVNNT